MQWDADASTSSGFTSAGVTPWLPINSNFVDVNVASQNATAFSHLNLFKQLMQVRYYDPTYDTGDTRVEAITENVLVISR